LLLHWDAGKACLLLQGIAPQVIGVEMDLINTILINCVVSQHRLVHRKVSAHLGNWPFQSNTGQGARVLLLVLMVLIQCFLQNHWEGEIVC